MPLLGSTQSRIFEQMKKISADYIFPGNTPPIKNGVLIIDNNGTIIDLLNPQKDEVNWTEVEIHKGFICPGFINTHCHLELSYLKHQIQEKTQLHGFIKEIITAYFFFNITIV